MGPCLARFAEDVLFHRENPPDACMRHDTKASTRRTPCRRGARRGLRSRRWSARGGDLVPGRPAPRPHRSATGCGRVGAARRAGRSPGPAARWAATTWCTASTPTWACRWPALRGRPAGRNRPSSCTTSTGPAAASQRSSPGRRHRQPVLLLLLEPALVRPGMAQGLAGPTFLLREHLDNPFSPGPPTRETRPVWPRSGLSGAFT